MADNKPFVILPAGPEGPADIVPGDVRAYLADAARYDTGDFSASVRPGIRFMSRYQAARAPSGSAGSAEVLLKDYELTMNRSIRWVNGNGKSIMYLLAELRMLDGADTQKKARTFCQRAGLADAQIDAIISHIMG